MRASCRAGPTPSIRAAGHQGLGDYVATIPAGGERRVRLRLSDQKPERSSTTVFGPGFADIFARRRQEADAFYDTVIPPALSADERNVMRQGLAGLLWSKQFYHFVVKTWLEGIPTRPRLQPPVAPAAMPPGLTSTTPT